jgi:hypothetical protein
MIARPQANEQTGNWAELSGRWPMSVVAGSAACATAALSLSSTGRPFAIALVAAQTLGVLWLGRLGYRNGGRWATATFIAAVSWVALFLMPCWIYAIDPGLLKTAPSPSQAIAIVDLSLFALIGGIIVARARWGARTPPELVQVTDPREPSTRALVGWGVLGVACLAVLVARNGGPVAYVTSQYRSGQLNSGLMYFIWGVLFLRYAPLAAVASRWARTLPAGRWLIAYLTIGSAIVVVMGARAFLAGAAIQVLLTATLVRRHLRLRSVAAPALVCGLLLVFGLGAVKFYQAYRATHPSHPLGLASYMVDVAPGKAVDDYANNYASGVSLIAQARRIVPAQADYEYGKVILRLALKPLPHPIRPAVREARAIRDAFDPNGGYTNAVPLQAISYLQFGLPGVAIVFVAFGALLAWVDRRLATPRQSLTALLPTVALAVEIPIVLRGGIPAGLVFLLIDVIGMWAAAVTVAGAPGAGRASLAASRARIGRRLRPNRP